MRIDAHQHFWIYNNREYDWIDESMAALRRDFLPHDLTPELAANNFDGSILVQTRQTLGETRWLLDLADRNRSIFGVVGWADLRSAEIHSQLKDLAQNRKLVGLRHIVQSEPDHRFLLQGDFLRGISALEDFDLAYDILIYTRHLPIAAEFVSRFPRQRFVLDHMAKPAIRTGETNQWADGIRRLAEYPNVLCKVSGLVTEAHWQHWRPEQITPYLDVAFDAFGPERLMIGSDWPVCLCAATYAQVMQVVKAYISRFSPECQAAVLGNNAASFWRLKSH